MINKLKDLQKQAKNGIVLHFCLMFALVKFRVRVEFSIGGILFSNAFKLLLTPINARPLKPLSGERHSSDIYFPECQDMYNQCNKTLPDSHSVPDQTEHTLSMTD